MPRYNTDHGQRDGGHDQTGDGKVLEFPDNETVDQHQGPHEGNTHVTEGFKGDCPFTLPFITGLVIILGRTKQVHRHGRHLHTIGRGVFPDIILNIKHAVDRCAQAALHLGHNIFNVPQILGEDNRVFGNLDEFPEFRKRDHPPVIGRYRQITQAGNAGPDGQWHLNHDIGGFQHRTALDITEFETTHGHGKGLVDGIHRDAAPYGLLGIHFKMPVVIRCGHIGIHIDHTLGLFEKAHHVRGNLAPGCGIRPVNFGHHGLQYRRTGWHFDNHDARTRTLRNRFQPAAGIFGDLMAAAFALILVHQQDLQLTVPGILAQVVMPNQAIEVEWLRGPCIGLHGRDFRHLEKLIRQSVSEVGRYRHGGPFRQIDNHTEFRLVIERQHLDHNLLGIKRDAQRGRQGDNAD